MEGRYFPALPGRDDTYTDDYKGNSSNSSPQRSLHAPKHSHKPQPPLGRGVETGVSPKRERLVQHLPEQQRYIGGGGAGYNSTNSSPDSIGAHVPTHTNSYYDNNEQSSTSRNNAFGPGARSKAGAGLAGLYNPSSSQAQAQAQAQGGRGAGPGAGGRGSGPGSNPLHRTPLKAATHAQNQRNMQARGVEIANIEQLNYIDELETHVESGNRDLGAWKIRYYVEFFRLLASRSHNKDIKAELHGMRNEVADLEHHAMDLSRRNSELEHKLVEAGVEGNYQSHPEAVQRRAFNEEKCVCLYICISYPCVCVSPSFSPNHTNPSSSSFLYLLHSQVSA